MLIHRHPHGPSYPLSTPDKPYAWFRTKKFLQIIPKFQIGSQPSTPPPSNDKAVFWSYEYLPSYHHMIRWSGHALVILYTVRLLTHVLCKPTHFFFHLFIATMFYCPQTSFISVMNGWADKYHVCGAPTRSPSRSNSR